MCPLPSSSQCIGIVPQDTVLFNDTILHNIKYGMMDATMEEVRHNHRVPPSLFDLIDSCLLSLHSMMYLDIACFITLIQNAFDSLPLCC
jgi:ABC-type multidrug transport system fused ATPase/permease subunit